MAEPVIDTDLSARIAEIRKEEGRGPACEGGIHTLDADRRCERCGRLVEERPDDGLFFSAADAFDIVTGTDSFGRTVTYDAAGNIISVTPAPSGEMR